MSKFILECEEEGFDAAPVEEYFSSAVDSDAEICAELVFTDEEGIRDLNRRERDKDAVTDVLSFPNLL